MTPFPVKDICLLVDGHLSYVETLDEYIPLTANNCQNFQGVEWFKLRPDNLIASAEALSAVRALAWVDVINDVAWLGVVITLELDVWLQIKGLLEGLLLQISKAIKAIFYMTLMGCAAYWGFLGGFLDFWDAFLWLLAFAFIEMNLFQWQQETMEHEEAA